MFVCLDCETLFYNPKCYTETHGLSSPPYEAWMGCPCCGGAYVETMRCDQCGNWVTGEYIKLKDGTVVCDQCYDINDIEDVY